MAVINGQLFHSFIAVFFHLMHEHAEFTGGVISMKGMLIFVLHFSFKLVILIVHMNLVIESRRDRSMHRCSFIKIITRYKRVLLGPVVIPSVMRERIVPCGVIMRGRNLIRLARIRGYSVQRNYWMLVGFC
jgi:hypothetical protein